MPLSISANWHNNISDLMRVCSPAICSLCAVCYLWYRFKCDGRNRALMSIRYVVNIADSALMLAFKTVVLMSLDLVRIDFCVH